MTVTLMSFRLRIMSAFLVVFGLLTATAFVVEARLAKPLEVRVEQQFVNPTGDFSQSDANDDGVVDYDPVLPSVSVEEWDREQRFLDHAQNLRFGHGPEIRSQVAFQVGEDVIRVAVAGDSYVFGEAVEDTNNRWPQQLEYELNRAVGRIAFEVVPIARQGSSSMDVADWVTPERLQRLDIDAFVLTYGRNDYNPSYHESWICAKFNRCVVDGEDPITSNHLNSLLVACLRGDDSPAGWIIKNVLNPWFPNLSSSLIDRYCDPDKMSNKLMMVTEGEILQDPTGSPYWPNYIESMNRLGRNLGDIPKYALYSGASGAYEEDMVPAHSQITRSGFEMLPMQNTIQLRQLVDSDKDLWVNPVDGHPNKRLASAYGRDAAVAVLRDFPGGSGKGRAFEPRPLISNYLPVQLTLSKLDANTMTVLLDPKNNQEHMYGTVVSSVSQTAPCVSLGRPHARIMFDPYRLLVTPDAGLRMTLAATEAPALVVPVTYNDDDEQVFLEPVRVLSGTTIDLPSGTAGVLIGGVTAGCPTYQDLNMFGFKAVFTTVTK